MDNNFREYKLKILGDLKRQNDALVKLQDIITEVVIDIARLKTTDRIIGSVVVGCIVAVLAKRLVF